MSVERITPNCAHTPTDLRGQVVTIQPILWCMLFWRLTFQVGDILCFAFAGQDGNQNFQTPCEQDKPLSYGLARLTACIYARVLRVSCSCMMQIVLA